jgi:hypothetical protein
VNAGIRIDLDVDCSAEHAFTVWTSGIGTWWPRDHTATGRAADIVPESGVGGRIYERTMDGVEHEWGRVTTWEPPRQLGYLWHLGLEPENATEVEITFHVKGSDATRIEIQHRGWERLGARASDWRDRNRAGWDALVPHLLAARSKGAD